MIIKEINKNLLTVNRKQFVIAHCISEDCAMGRGVVVPIIKKHPKLKKACKTFSSQNNVVGKAFRYRDNNGIVYNLFSKKHVWQKAGKYLTVKEYHDNLKNCLLDLKEQMKENNEEYLAIPQIASGLDGCKWDDVKNIIKNVFKDTNIKILVCVWN